MGKRSPYRGYSYDRSTKNPLFARSVAAEHLTQAWGGGKLADMARIVTRYLVSTSHGSGFAVWDRHDARIVSRHKTFTAAQLEAKRLNDPLRK